MNKNQFKKTPEELREWLHTKHRTFIVPAKKGKGSYTRKRKHKDLLEK